MGGPGDGAVAPGLCSASAPGNRCASVTRGLGGEPAIDDFEAVAGEDPACRAIRAADGRQGAWSVYDGPAYVLAAPGPGGAPGSTRALHASGTGAAAVAVALAPCYDASKYQGLSFWLKGTATAAPRVKLMVATPATAEASRGGACVPKADPMNGACDDHFTVAELVLSEQWTRYAVTWKQLAQTGVGQLAGGGYHPEAQILAVLFQPVWDDASRAFDFWLDDVSFEVSGPFAATGFSQIITQAKFDAAFNARRGAAAKNALFTNAYADLTTALELPEFSRIGREGTADDRKREIAALLAHVAQETGSLQYAVELNTSDPYCDTTNTLYPCVPGQSYFGRGPLQLSWNYNYGAASLFLGLGDQLLKGPATVASDGPLAWKTALYFWTKWKDYGTNVLKIGPHYRFLHDGFGATIRIINGAIECPASAAATSRGNHFQAFCGAIGVGGCDKNLACTAM
jgi:chitinase